MSFFGLNIAGSALAAFQDAANVTSDDIANVNTPGASRQTVQIVQNAPVVGSPGYATWAGPGTKGDGISVGSIARIHQDSYDSLFRGASSSQNFYDVQSQQLSAVQASFAEPSGGVNKAFSDLQTALSQLASNPRGTSERQGVIAKTQAFVSTLNRVSNAISGAKATAIQQATATVAQVNALVDKIAAFNGQIRASKAIGDNPNTYQDQRDQLVDQLSTLLATQSAIQGNGSTLVTVGGRALVNDTQAYHLANPVIGTDPSGNAVLVVGFQNDPVPSNPTPIPLGSGQLQGYVDLYNAKLAPYGAQLDAFANASAYEIDQVTTATFDQNGNAGQALLQPLVASQAVSASNIKVGITDPAQVGAALASTVAGNLTVSANSANNVVNTAQAIAGNITLNYPATAGTGTLTVTADGVAQAYAYDTNANGNADTIDHFISNFNAAQLGVSASFDQTAQKIVFSRDPVNVSLGHRAAVAAAGTQVSPDFTISDSNAPAAVPPPPGTNSTSILEVLGAGAIQGVVQNAGNAFGAGDNGGANATLGVFARNAGIPSLQTSSPTAIAGPGAVTVLPPAANPQAFSAVNVGQVLTIGAGTAAQENVVVSAVNRFTGSLTFTAANAHAANFAISSGRSQTLGAFYAGIVGRLGFDTQTAAVGANSQTKLALNIDKVRQSIQGINIDEETQNLVKFQNAYSAAAKTLNVLESLITTAVGLIR